MEWRTGGDGKPHYEIWKHADRLLSAVDPSDQDLQAAIIQLDRAVDFRQKLLNEIYHFEKLPGMRKKNVYEITVELGIVKPLMKARLAGLRNKLMHNNAAKQPDVAACRELSEFAWYYLRSTDYLLTDTVCAISLELLPRGRLQIDFRFDPWSVWLNGWVPREALSDGCSDDYFEVESPRPFEIDRDGAASVTGHIVGPPDLLPRLVRMYFATD
jgi:hypothetical protein